MDLGIGSRERLICGDRRCGHPRERQAEMRNPLSTEALVDWLAKQPAKGRYSYDANCGCLLHQYLTNVGFSDVVVGGYNWDDARGRDHRLPDGWNDIAVRSPCTYGAALRRAKAWLAAAVR